LLLAENNRAIVHLLVANQRANIRFQDDALAR
jgi:hypothetical protein